MKIGHLEQKTPYTFVKTKEIIIKFLAISTFFALLYSLLLIIDYKWEFDRLLRFIVDFREDGIHLGSFLKGLIITLKISIIAMLTATFIGTITALGSIINLYSINIICKIYITTIRNTPLMTQILINYFVIGHIFNINGTSIAIITLSLFEGAYISEIIRGSILSIDKQQWITGYALGLNRFQTIRKIILPQAFPIIIPSLGNILISTVKDSSLLSIISITEMTFEAQKAASETFMIFEVWFTVAFLYFSINIIITMLIKILEKKLSRWRV